MNDRPEKRKKPAKIQRIHCGPWIISCETGITPAIINNPAIPMAAKGIPKKNDGQPWIVVLLWPRFPERITGS